MLADKAQSLKANNSWYSISKMKLSETKKADKEQEVQMEKLKAVNQRVRKMKTSQEEAPLPHRLKQLTFSIYKFIKKYFTIIHKVIN